MGASLRWLAVRGKTPKAVRSELGLRSSSKREKSPRSAVTGAELPGGWYLIVENHRLKNQFGHDAVVERLSAGCEVVTCAVEEHVMCSEAAAWKDGVKKWSVIHEAEEGDKDLRTEGELPTVFNSILDRLTAEQDGEADYVFDVPVELAESLTGYRYDVATPELGDAPFEVFVSQDASQAALKFVFRLVIASLGFLLSPLFYLRGITGTDATPCETVTGQRVKRKGSGCDTVLILSGLGCWAAISFYLFRLVWLFHVRMYPEHNIHDFWGPGISTRSFIPSFVMVFAPIPGAMASGFLLSALFWWFVVPPMRRAFQAASPDNPGAAFWRAMRGLFKYGVVTLSIGLVTALVAASLLKSLR